MVLKIWLMVAGSLAFATHSIPGLGDVTISEADDRLRFALSGRDFHVARTIGSGGEVEITVGGGGELMPLTVRFGGRERLTIKRGANVLVGASQLSAGRQLTDGRAVASFREHVGEFERRLLSHPDAAGSDDPHAHGVLASAALVSALAGDPSAIGRVRDIVMRRTTPALRDRRGEAEPCRDAYVRRLPEIDDTRAACWRAADDNDSWHERKGQRLLCDAEYVAGLGAAEARFVACRSARSSGHGRGGAGRRDGHRAVS